MASIPSQGTVWQGSEDDGTTWVDLGCIKSWNWEKPERAQIDTSCVTSTEKEYRFGLRDAGTVALDFNYVPGEAGIKLLERSYSSDDVYMFKVTYNDDATTPTEKTFKGNVISLSESGATDDIVNASASIKLSGAVTTTP